MVHIVRASQHRRVTATTPPRRALEARVAAKAALTAAPTAPLRRAPVAVGPVPPTPAAAAATTIAGAIAGGAAAAIVAVVPAMRRRRATTAAHGSHTRGVDCFPGSPLRRLLLPGSRDAVRCPCSGQSPNDCSTERRRATFPSAPCWSGTTQRMRETSAPHVRARAPAAVKGVLQPPVRGRSG